MRQFWHVVPHEMQSVVRAIVPKHLTQGKESPPGQFAHMQGIGANSWEKLFSTHELLPWVAWESSWPCGGFTQSQGSRRARQKLQNTFQPCLRNYMPSP